MSNQNDARTLQFEQQPANSIRLERGGRFGIKISQKPVHEDFTDHMLMLALGAVTAGIGAFAVSGAPGAFMILIGGFMAGVSNERARIERNAEEINEPDDTQYCIDCGSQLSPFLPTVDDPICGDCHEGGDA